MKTNRALLMGVVGRGVIAVRACEAFAGIARESRAAELHAQ